MVGVVACEPQDGLGFGQISIEVFKLLLRRQLRVDLFGRALEAIGLGLEEGLIRHAGEMVRKLL